MSVWELLVKYNEGTLSYQEGVSLFFRIWPESSLKDFFEVEDRYSRKRLKEALQGKYSEMAANIQENNFKSFAPSVHANNPVNMELLPAELRTEYMKLNQIIREISSLHARLFNCSTDQERYALAERIYSLTSKRRMIFTRVDSYLSTGRDPLREKEPKLVPAASKLKTEKNYALEYNLKLLRTQKSKLKKNPRRIKDYEEVCKQIDALELKRYEGAV